MYGGKPCPKKGEGTGEGSSNHWVGRGLGFVSFVSSGLHRLQPFQHCQSHWIPATPISTRCIRIPGPSPPKKRANSIQSFHPPFTTPPIPSVDRSRPRPSRCPTRALDRPTCQVGRTGWGTRSGAGRTDVFPRVLFVPGSADHPVRYGGLKRLLHVGAS